MHKPDTLSVVYFDVCAYSQMELSRQISCIQAVEHSIEELRDPEFSPIVEGGDSFAIGFSTPNDAIHFATRLARSLKTANFKMRIGITTGEAIIRKTINGIENIYGKAIDFASRLASCCLPGQILVAAHTLDDVASQNNPWCKYIVGKGKYKIKHDVCIEVYNLFSCEFGVSELPLKKRVDDYSFFIIVGDRREIPAKTVGDLFHLAPSIDDLSHIFKFDWPEDIILRGDKIMCWARNRSEQESLKKRNLFIIGSPKVNIAALMVNSSSFFRFGSNNADFYEKDIRTIHEMFSDSPPNDIAFIEWRDKNINENINRFSRINYLAQAIEDPISGTQCVNSQNDSYGLVSFAKHPFSTDENRFSIVIAGIDLCATLTITKRFFEIDFARHPLGGIIRIQRLRNRHMAWFEVPHHGKLHTEDGTYWITPEYTLNQLVRKLPDCRGAFARRLLSNTKMSMTRIQTLLRK